MKLQDEHGPILVSGALDPRKMISPKIPKILGGSAQKSPIVRGGPNKNKISKGRRFGWGSRCPKQTAGRQLLEEHFELSFSCQSGNPARLADWPSTQQTTEEALQNLDLRKLSFKSFRGGLRGGTEESKKIDGN